MRSSCFSMVKSDVGDKFSWYIVVELHRLLPTLHLSLLKQLKIHLL